ncbi:hypothetical protein Bca101_022845 [Brassica carinata]
MILGPGEALALTVRDSSSLITARKTRSKPSSRMEFCLSRFLKPKSNAKSLMSRFMYPLDPLWSFESNVIGSIGLKKDPPQPSSHCSDDEVSNVSRDEDEEEQEGLDCPICFESFNIVENVPYVLWCGHTLCQNCIFALQPAVSTLSGHDIRVPFFVSCPWCQLLSLRIVYNGVLMFPRKNFFLLWMVESLNGDRTRHGGGGSLVSTDNNNQYYSSNLIARPAVVVRNRTTADSISRSTSLLISSSPSPPSFLLWSFSCSSFSLLYLVASSFLLFTSSSRFF